MTRFSSKLEWKKAAEGFDYRAPGERYDSDSVPTVMSGAYTRFLGNPDSGHPTQIMDRHEKLEREDIDEGTIHYSARYYLYD